MTKATFPFERVTDLYMDSHYGVHVNACRTCRARVLEVWREVCFAEYEDLWAFWVPVRPAEEARLAEQLARDTGLGMRMAREIVESRDHLVCNTLGNYYWSPAGSEIGLGMLSSW